MLELWCSLTSKLSEEMFNRIWIPRMNFPNCFHWFRVQPTVENGANRNVTQHSEASHSKAETNDKLMHQNFEQINEYQGRIWSCLLHRNKGSHLPEPLFRSQQGQITSFDSQPEYFVQLNGVIYMLIVPRPNSVLDS